MSILVVGSVAYDTVETPFGKAERVLGGSASFFSVAASFFIPVRLVAVVGEDFGEEQLAAFQDRPIDLEGLERVDLRAVEVHRPLGADGDHHALRAEAGQTTRQARRRDLLVLPAQDRLGLRPVDIRFAGRTVASWGRPAVFVQASVELVLLSAAE